MNTAILKSEPLWPIRPLMGRFSRMHGVHYSTWAPPESSVRIEYSSEVLREVRWVTGAADVSGILFGIRTGSHVRVVAARPTGARTNAIGRDPLLAGLDPVGIFAVRMRGEVFLTETDLQRLEEFSPERGIAMVVAGEKAGFFVREPDGSIQTIQSYGEFSLTGNPPAAVVAVKSPERALPCPAPIRQRRTTHLPALLIWVFAAGLAAAASLLLLIARHDWRPVRPLALQMLEQEGQLRIYWNRGETGRGGSLEITDGAEHTAVRFSGDLANVTYAPRGANVQVRLTMEDERVGSRHETVLFVRGETPEPQPKIEHAPTEISKLEAEAGELRFALEGRRTKAAELQEKINGIARGGSNR